jgi:hypothetical protein
MFALFETECRMSRVSRSLQRKGGVQGKIRMNERVSNEGFGWTGSQVHEDTVWNAFIHVNVAVSAILDPFGALI